MVRGTWTILHSRLQVARNIFWRGKLLRKIGVVALLALAASLSYGLFRLSGALVRGLRLLQREEPALIAQLGDLPGILAAVPSILLATATAPLLISSISFALGTLYLARDLELLLVTPVPMRSVFLARFLEGLLPTYLMLFLLLLPALIGYGLALDYRFGYALVLPLVLLLLPLLPVSAGVMLTMGLVRLIPPRRLRELMAVLSGLIGVLFYIGTQLLGRNPGVIGSAESAQRLLWLDAWWLPTTWAARAIVAAGRGDFGLLARYGLPYLFGSAGLFLLATAMAERLYYIGWAKVAGNGERTRRRERRPRSSSVWPRGPAGAILLKDLRMLPRDLQRLSQLLIPLGLSVFWIWQLVSMRSGRLGRGAFGSLTTIALLVCILLGSNLALSGVSREGRGFWLLKLAPISPWPILWAKWALAFLPFPIVASLFVVLVGLLRDPPALELLRSWVIVTLTGVGVSGIATGMGAAYPRLDWLNAQRMNSFRGGCLASIGYYTYAALVWAATIGAEPLVSRWGTPVVVGGWLIAVILTGLALWLPLALAARNLRRLDL